MAQRYAGVLTPKARKPVTKSQCSRYSATTLRMKHTAIVRGLSNGVAYEKLPPLKRSFVFHNLASHGIRHLRRTDMVTNPGNEAVDRFREHIDELTETLYPGASEQAFRHVAFQQTAPDPALSDQQNIELTAIDKSGDLEIDGFFDDDTAEEFFLFQSAGGLSRIGEDKVTKFWEAPQEILLPDRISNTPNQSVRELSRAFEEKLKEGYGVRMVFASRGGFAPAATQFASSKSRIERPILLSDGTRTTVSCTLQLEDEESLSKLFDDYKAGLRIESYEVTFTLAGNMSYSSAKDGLRFLRTHLSSQIAASFRCISRSTWDAVITAALC